MSYWLIFSEPVLPLSVISNKAIIHAILKLAALSFIELHIYLFFLPGMTLLGARLEGILHGFSALI